MHNIREIEACASAIPCSVKNNGNQDVYDLRQVILKNRFCVTDELEHIKEIVTEMFCNERIQQNTPARDSHLR